MTLSINIHAEEANIEHLIFQARNASSTKSYEVYESQSNIQPSQIKPLSHSQLITLIVSDLNQRFTKMLTRFDALIKKTPDIRLFLVTDLDGTFVHDSFPENGILRNEDIKKLQQDWFYQLDVFLANNTNIFVVYNTARPDPVFDGSKRYVNRRSGRTMQTLITRNRSLRLPLPYATISGNGRHIFINSAEERAVRRTRNNTYFNSPLDDKLNATNSFLERWGREFDKINTHRFIANQYQGIQFNLHGRSTLAYLNLFNHYWV